MGVKTFQMKIREERREAKLEGAIEIAKELNADRSTIIKLLQKIFKITLKEAEEALNDYEADEQNE